MMRKIAMFFLVSAVLGQLENDITPPSIAELASALMGGNDRRPCSFVTGEMGKCVPFFNCIDVTTLKGDGACNLLSVCCKPEFIYEIQMNEMGSTEESESVEDTSDPSSIPIVEEVDE